MMFKRGYLFLTAAFLLVSFGTGFAMQERGQYNQAALGALQTASLQLSKGDYGPDQQTRLLVDEAIRRLKHRTTYKKG